MESQQSPARPEAKRRSWKTALIVAGTGLLVLLACLGAFDMVGAGKLKRAIDEARAIGGPLTIEELLAARPIWSEQDNGAQVILAVRSDLDTLSKSAGTDKLPVIGSPGPIFGHQWSASTVEATTAFLEAQRPLLAELDGLGRYRGGRMPFQIAENPVNTMLPHLSGLRWATRLKCLEALDAARRGDTQHLGERFRIMLMPGSLLVDEPMLLSQLVNMGCTNLSVHTLEEICALTVVEAPELLAIQHQLVPLEDLHSRVSLGIRGERAIFLGNADYLRQNGNDGRAYGPAMPAAKHMPGVHGYFMQDEALGLTFFNRMVKAADTSRLLDEARTVDLEVQALRAPSVLTRILMPSLSRAVINSMSAIAEVRCARTAMAAERYRLATGQFPAQLTDLVPGYIDAVPSDPFAIGQPLKLATTADRIVTYSIGEDRRDNGGDARRDGTRNRGSDCGFILLIPSARNQPPLPDEPDESDESEIGASQPARSPRDSR